MAIENCPKCGGTHYGSFRCPFDDDSPNVKDHEASTGMITPSQGMIGSSELACLEPDIVERLRVRVFGKKAVAERNEAADEIERLRAIIVADTHVILSKRPVAWRVKDFADGWIIFDDEHAAYKAHEANGGLMQGLYARDGNGL